MNWFTHSLRPCALAITLTTLSGIAIAQQPNVAPSTPVTLNFVDADIDVVAKAIGELTGKTFVIDPKVKGKINIQSANGISPGLAYPTFLSALRMNGFAAVEGPGGVVRVVPEIDAKTLPTPLSGATAGSITTKILPLQHQSALQVINAVRPLVSASNALTAYPAGNAIIITDYGDNIRKVEEVINRLDVPSQASAELITLNNANAVDVATTLNRVFADAPTGQPEARDRLVIAPDVRSNAIIVRSEDAGRLSRIKSLIQDLDRPGNAPGNLRIVYLKHADASQVAQTLRRVLGADNGSGGSSSSSSLGSLIGNSNSNNAASGGLNTAALTALMGGNNSNGNNGNSAFAGSGNLPSSAQNNNTAFTANGATVYADTSVNALVISAPNAVYNNMRNVIEQLDVRRAQVFIEALIAEVQADRAAEFGIQWQFLNGLNSSGTQGFGGTNFGSSGNILGLVADPTKAASGLNLGLMRGKFKIGDTEFFNLGLLARAMQTDLGANILSMPTLLAMDNEESRFSGGQNIPLVTGTYTNTGSGGGSVDPFQTVERKDVGLILKVRPLITEGGAIRLQLYQEVSSVVPVSEAKYSGLNNINKRVLESTVLADDGQIVVLGGLLQEGYTDGQDKVPVLGDVPVIGNLFRYDSRKRTKTNLMIFLRPTVVKDAAQAAAFSNERYRTLGMDAASVTAEPRALLPEMTTPQLPFGTPAP